MTITLREITKDNWRDATQLSVDDTQKGYVAPNWRSILEVVFAEVDIYSRAIYNDDEMVGYAMMGQDPDDKVCFISRLMIDQKHQNKGYGRVALAAIIEDMKKRYNPDGIIISFVPENTVARKLYEQMGFVDTGETHHGELVFRLPLNG